MVVITLTDCPPALRGDLTKWLQEINTGVYVGRVSARVREMVWKRVKESAKSGRATMVYSTNNEQRMDFRVHNTTWEPIDFDGLKLILRPSPARIKKLADRRMGYSKAARMRKAKQMSRPKRQKPLPTTYTVIDLETTGPSPKKDKLLSINAIIVSEGEIQSRFHSLIKPVSSNSLSTKQRTNATEKPEERDIKQVLPEFLTFINDTLVVAHNEDFIYSFLRIACEQCGLPLFSNKCVDILSLSRRLVDDVKNYRFETLLEHFKIETSVQQTCETTKVLYDKLIELQQVPE